MKTWSGYQNCPKYCGFYFPVTATKALKYATWCLHAYASQAQCMQYEHNMQNNIWYLYILCHVHWCSCNIVLSAVKICRKNGCLWHFLNFVSYNARLTINKEGCKMKFSARNRLSANKGAVNKQSSTGGNASWKNAVNCFPLRWTDKASD